MMKYRFGFVCERVMVMVRLSKWEPLVCIMYELGVGLKTVECCPRLVTQQCQPSNSHACDALSGSQFRGNLM